MKLVELKIKVLKTDTSISQVFVKQEIKHKKIGKLLKELNLSWDNLVYVGDDLNDLETIKRSDYGIEIFGYKCIVFTENMINKLFKKSENNN